MLLIEFGDQIAMGIADRTVVRIKAGAHNRNKVIGISRFSEYADHVADLHKRIIAVFNFNERLFYRLHPRYAKISARRYIGYQAKRICTVIGKAVPDQNLFTLRTLPPKRHKGL